MKAYTVNNHLVGVGNDQILGTDQGGGGGVEYEAGQYISIDENNVISVTGLAPATALPTTEFGKFTIQNNVSGGPIEVICPTDQGHAVYDVLMDSNSVSGTYEITGGYKGVLFKSPGYDNDYWNYTAGTVTIHVPEAVTGIAGIYACYASNSNPTSGYGTGPNFFSNYPWYNPDSSTYILQPGNYEIATVANQVPEYAGGYGKYISIVATGPGPDLNALSKISFAGMERHPELGYDVNLDRYYLGNNVTTSTPSSDSVCQVTVDSTSKKQTVYLPNNIPSSWMQKVNVLLPYGTTSNPSIALYTYYGAYKQESGTSNMQYAVCVDHNWTNKIMTFIAFDKNGNAFEKWTYNWGTSPKTWTTEQLNYITDGDLELNGDSEVTAINGHAIASESFEQVNSDWNANSGVAEILNKPTEIQLIAGANVQVEVTGASAIISAQGGGGAGYATETYVQNYVQNYSIPVQVVANSAAATGTNILYVVTGS